MLHLFDFSLLCIFKWSFKLRAREEVKSHWLHLFYFYWGFIVAYVAFVWFFSTVHFQMIHQTPCLRRGIVTLVAFVLLFSTVRFQMFLQTPYLRRGIVALVALDLSLLCIFCMLPQMAIIRVSIVTLVAFVLLFSTVRFPRLPQMAFIRGCRVA